jgi:predicted GIY-YIG superfamily endonuclease
VWQNREKVADGFTKKYSVTQLVWYEIHDDVMAAIKREKQLKEWKRAWKIELIQRKTRTGAICMTISAQDNHHGSRLAPG